MVGPPYDVTNVGGDVAWQLGGIGAAFVALMSMFFVGRHTRGGGAERAQRADRRRAGRRHAPLAAALFVVAARRCCSARPWR